MRASIWALAAITLTAAAYVRVHAQEGLAASSDAAALLALQNSITNWPQYAAANQIVGWNDSVPLCSWTGVECTSSGAVQSLLLQCEDCALAAQGTLPAELANLLAATTLNLQGNAFVGMLPQQWGGPGVLQALQNLYLNDNQLSGTLPAAWGNQGAFPKLSLMRIDGNRLTGSLPGNWGTPGSGGGNQSLPNLLVLRLFGNRLSGTLPDDWGAPGTFPRLQVLALQNNSLTGPLPDSWQNPGAMGYLQEMYLQQNELHGQLPASWGGNNSWPALRFIQLGPNPLGGTLPPEWGQPASLPALRNLQLNSTQLTGTLPPEWGSGGLAAADAFWLERNNLSGSIPPSWENLKSLSRLVVRPGNPLLCGPVPAGLPFSICTDDDLSCLKDKPTLTEGQCTAAAAGVAPRAEAADGPPAAVVPQPPQAAEPSSSSESGGGGVSAVAIAVPVSLGVGALLAGGVGIAYAARRKRRRREHEGEAARRAAAGRGLGAHPFDTEEGRAALTSPFAAGAFQTGPTFNTGGSHSDASSQQAAGRSQRGAAQGSRSPGRQRGPHDSAGTHSSSMSGSSYRSYMAKCARIQTKSFTGALPGDAAAGGGSSSSGDPGRRSLAAALGGGTAGEPASPGRQALEMQPLGGFGGEERDFVGEMLGRSPHQQGSSDQTSAESGPATGFELPFSDWEISPAEIEIAKRPDGSDWSLGSGGFGKVYKGLRNGVQPVAVKVLATQGEMRQMAMVEFRKEVAILKACRDVNIVQFVGACLTPDRTMLVTEYMEGGNLANNISAGRVSWYRRGKKIALDVARGLVFLHSRRVVHFDIKSPNVLLARDGTAKIGDVGMAKILARDYVTGVVGTLAWAAPEMLWGERCTEKADIYSYGIVLWEICSGEKPMRGQLRDLAVPQECPSAVRDLILECLETRPSRRPSALEVVQRLQALPDQPPPGVRVEASPRQNRLQPAPTPATPETGSSAAVAAVAPTPPAGSSAGGTGPPSPTGGASSPSGQAESTGGGAATASHGSRLSGEPVSEPTAAERLFALGNADGSNRETLAPRLALGPRSRSVGQPPLGTAANRMLRAHQTQWQPGEARPAAAAEIAPANVGPEQQQQQQQQQGGHTDSSPVASIGRNI